MSQRAVLPTPPQRLSLRRMWICYSTVMETRLVTSKRITFTQTTLWNSSLPLCQSALFLYGGNVEGRGGRVVKHDVLPQSANSTWMHTHRLQGSFFDSLFFYFIFFLFKADNSKKAENTGVLRALMLWSSRMCLFLYVCRLAAVQISSGNLFQVTGAFNCSWVYPGNY